MRSGADGLVDAVIVGRLLFLLVRCCGGAGMAVLLLLNGRADIAPPDPH